MRSRMQQWIGCSLLIFSASLLGLAGWVTRGSGEPKPPQPVVKVDNLGKAIQVQPVARVSRTPPLPSFKDAVILDPPPEDEQRPPDMTVNGKNVGKVFETIANDLWDTVTFTNNDGKPIKYQAVVTTELGEIQIDLLGDAAPNHVRSFVCLARTGYYDGMAFYYSIRRTVFEDTSVLPTSNQAARAAPANTARAASATGSAPGISLNSSTRTGSSAPACIAIRTPPPADFTSPPPRCRRWMANSRRSARSARGWTSCVQSIQEWYKKMTASSNRW